MIPKLISILCLFAAIPTARAAEFFIAPSGNDAWSGKLAQANDKNSDGPFLTLERARDAAREVRKTAPADAITVSIRAGFYRLPKGFKLSKEDSGQAGAPVTWRGYNDEWPVLVGGKVVSGFEPFKGEILKVDLAAQGLKDAKFSQLIFNGERQHLARWPNYDPQNPYGGGWAYADGKLVPMYAEVPGEDRRTFKYKEADARPGTWANPAEAEVFVFARYNWWNNIVRFASVDPATRTIKLSADCSYPIRPGDRYYVQNVFEELDAPGEWYLDKKSATLYFWPPKKVRAQAVEVLVPTTRTILDVGEGAHHLTIRGLRFQCCEGTAVEFKNASDCLFAGNKVTDVGDYHGSGVGINGGFNNGVAGCDISGTGSNGVSINGGDRKTLTAGNNYADNNYIHHVGVFYKQGVGISMSGCGNRASHNLIHDGPRMGIMFSGNNLIIEYNHIRHINLETADTGAVYTGGRDWISSRGTVIRYNYFHDSLGYGFENGKWESPHYSWGIYLDDNAGGVDVIGNIVARARRGPLHLHNGRDNLVENNIFVDGKIAQIECNGWTEQSRSWATHLPTMIKGYESVIDQPAWKSMRNMDLHPSKAVLPDSTIMSGNVFQRNILVSMDAKAKAFKVGSFNYEKNPSDYNLVWNTAGPVKVGMSKPKTAAKNAPAKENWEDWQAAGEDAHSLVADPMFVDAAKDDYRLKPDSPAFKLGFKAIPVEKIGPYKDELRATWPIVEAEGAREKPLTP